MHHIYLRITPSVISNHIAYQTRAYISLAGRIIFAFIQPRSFLVGVRTQSSSRSLIPLFTVAKKRAVARHDAVPARGHPIRKPAILNESKFSKPTNEANVAADVLKERVSQANCERAIQSSQKRESSD